jgi:hypothetical protein
MKVPFRVERSESSLHFFLAYCPLCASGSKTGLGREMAIARVGFAAFAASLVRSTVPGWIVLTPQIDERSDSLLEISLSPA